MHRQKMVRSVASNPDNLENSKKVSGAQGIQQGLSKNCKNRESAPYLSRLIRGFRNKHS